jgi:hypothetical protein
VSKRVIHGGPVEKSGVGSGGGMLVVDDEDDEEEGVSGDSGSQERGV